MIRTPAGEPADAAPCAAVALASDFVSPLDMLKRRPSTRGTCTAAT